MQLGASKSPASARILDGWAEEAAAEAEAEEASNANSWGSDDLMDVNADQDDWSECSFLYERQSQRRSTLIGAFESAPVQTSLVETSSGY